MANNMTFSIGLKTNYDASGVNQLKKELQDIQNLTSVSTGFINKSNVKDLMAMTSAANELERALDAAYDPQLNTVSIDKFNQSLKNSGTNIQKVQQDLSKAGIVGQQAFLKTTGELLQMNATVRNTNSLLDKMATTMANTVRWGITSALWNNITGSIQTAFYYVKDLDTALNDIRIVTGKSAEDMANFAVEANNAAKALAVTTEDYTRGALIYYQQGLDDETVRTLTDITSMTANVTGQGMDTVSEQLTAVWNGYQVANQAAEEGIGVYEEYVDKMAAVGAATASDLEELSTAMSKVASAAASMGVGFDSLNAQIATIVSVTRQAPESVGTALKTIYARMGDLQLGKSDEDGVGLGQVSGELDKLGIAVLDANGNMRDMEEVITEVGEAWDTWTEAERQAIAVALAGKRQYNNLIALFDNWTMYTDTLNVSLESAGTLQEQQAIATESLANKMDVLRATAEDLYDNLFNEEVIGKGVDVFTDFVQILADVTEALGGLENILPALSGVMMTMFSNQIGKNIGDLIIGFQNLTSTSQNSLQNLQALKDMFQGGLVNADLNTLGISQDSANMETLKASLADIVNYYEDMASKRSLMNEKEYEAYNAILKQKVAVGDLQLEYVKLSQSLLKDNHAQFLLGSGGISFNSDEDIARLKQDTVALQNYYDLLDTRSVKSAKTVGELRDALENLNNQNSSINHLDFSNITGSLEEFFGEFKYSNNVEVASQDLQQYRQRILQTIQTAQNLTSTNDKLASSFGNTADSVNRLNQQLELKAAINTISRLTGSVTQLVSALSILKNIGNIWNNENLTGSEKFLQIMANLGSGVGLIISGITGLVQSYQILSQQTSIFLPLQTLLNKEKREEIIQNNILLQQSKLRIANQEIEKLQQEKAIILEWLQDKSLSAVDKKTARLMLTENAAALTKARLNKMTAESAINNTVDATSKGINAKATGALTKAQWLLNAAMTANPIGAVVAILAGLAIAIGAVYVIYQKFILTAEEANEAFQEANKKYIEATSELEDYTSQIEECKEKLAELYDIAKKDLTITNKEDIVNLEREVALLEQKKLLAEETQKEAQEDAVRTLNRARRQDSYSLDNFQANNAISQTREQQVQTSSGEWIGVAGAGDTEELDGGVQQLYENYLRQMGYTGKTFEMAKASDIGFIDFIDTVLRPMTETDENTVHNVAGTKLTAHEIKQIISTLQPYYGDIDANWEEFDLDATMMAIDAARKTSGQEENVQYGLDLITKYLTDKGLMGNIAENSFTRIAEDEAEFNKILNELSFNEDGSINYGNLSTEIISKIQEQADLNYVHVEDLIESAFAYNIKYNEDLMVQSTSTQLKTLRSYLDEHTKLRDKVLQLADTGFLNEESLEALPEYSELLELVGGDVEKLIEALEKLEDQSITAFDSLNDLSDIQSGFDSLATVYQQKLSEGGMVDLESLTGLYNDFGDVEGFNDFIAVMQDMNATSEEVQIAFNNLATSYVKQKFGLLEITEANKDYVAAVMTTMGITNAQEVVNWQLTKSGEMYTEALADIQEATSQTAMTSEELQNATTEELEALYEEAVAAGYDAESLRVLLIAKQNINLAELDTADDVEALLAIGGAAVLSGKQLEYLLQLEAQLAELDYNYQVGNIKDSGAYQAQRDNIFSKYNEGLESAKDDYRKTVEDMMAEVEVGMPEINFDGTSIDKDSGSSSRSTKDQKDFDDEYDRYWEFNKLIEKVTNTIEDLDEAQENLHGRELISALENENRLLDKQAEAYEKLYAEQKREQAELQSSLGSLGLQFDADGAITNYAAQTSQMLSDYNKAVAEYNAGMMNEETFAIYEQNYEKFKTGLARYEELYYSEMKDAQDKLEEIRKQQRANNLEAWEIDIELKLETSEFERDVANFLHDIEDDFKKVYEDLGDDFENIFANMGTYDTDVSTTLQAIKDVTAEIDKMQNGGESDMFESISQAQEKLKDLNKDLQDSASSMHDLWVDAWDTYMEGIDQSADKLEDLNEKYERIGQEIEFQGDLIKLLYGDEAYDLMADYFDAQKTNTLAQVDSFRQQRDMWKQMYESAEDGSEDQQKYYELMNEAQDNLNGSVKEYIELLQNEATNAIDGALKKYENLITNGQGLDVVNEQWERTKDYADAVFDSVEKTYHVQDLASKIKQSINDAEGLKSQQKLQELYDKEINYLLNKKELTQYDIDAANARYQIALKEIALEEAQNAKNSMKVVRGVDGNWDYQYVADDENVEEKKRELSDSIYALYELANNSYMESMNNLLEIEQKYQEQAKALAEEAVQTGADVSERKRALDEWYESEKTRISEQGALARQDMLTSSVGVLKDAYDNNVINYENMTNSQIALIEGVSQAGVDSFADLEVKINDNFQNIGDMAHQVIAETVPEWNSAAWDIAEQWIGDDGSIKQAFEETGATLTQITEDYRTDVDELGEVADMNLGEDGIAGALQDNIELTEELEGATENLVDTSVDALEEYQDALSAVEDAWYAVKDSITSAIDEIREYLALAGQASNVDVSMNNTTAGRGNNWDFGTGDAGDGDGPGKVPPGGKGNTVTLTKVLVMTATHQGAWGEKLIYSDGTEQDVSNTTKSNTEHIGKEKGGFKINQYKWKNDKWEAFKTGGYTGEWGGGEGRMAMLHSKELVLNAKDTENILDAVSAVRSFASIGNSINEAIMSGIAKMLLSASGKVLGSVSKVDNSSNDNSQNIFHINAEFPNANDMAEIQAAILSLPRIASQQTEIIVK